MKQVQAYGVELGDLRDPNFLWESHRGEPDDVVATGRLMICDLERATMKDMGEARKKRSIPFTTLEEKKNGKNEGKETQEELTSPIEKNED